MKSVIIVVMGCALVGGTLGRTKLVDILTKTTGTWVGSPSARK